MGNVGNLITRYWEKKQKFGWDDIRIWQRKREIL